MSPTEETNLPQGNDAAHQETATAPAPAPRRGYFSSTRRWLYAFTFVIPLAAIYELIVFLMNRGSQTGIRNGADVWIRNFMDMLGLGGTLPLLLLSVLLWVVIYIGTRSRDKDFRMRPIYFLGMLLESAVWGVILLFAVGYTTYFLFNLHPLFQTGNIVELDKGTLLGLSLGAGVYEELIFRVLLMGGMVWLFTRLGMRRFPAGFIGVVASSLIFAWAHYTGSMGDSFHWESFINRAIAGMAFAGLYAWRGYGIAAWAHALYDVYIIFLF
jgi:membrane protease YdiL (CAAX protease family)